MAKKQVDIVDELLKKNAELQSRLSESEEALSAIRNGEVDAIVVSGAEGEKIFSLTSAETPYRIILEEMAEGAVIIKADGTIFYCNQRFIDIFSDSSHPVVGSNILRFVLGSEKPTLNKLIKKGLKERVNGTIFYSNAQNKSELYLNFSLRPLPPEVDGDICIIISDITKTIEFQDHLQELVKKRTEDLERVNAKLNIALESGNIGIWEWDFKTDEVIWDERLEKMFGLNPGEFGKTYDAFEKLVNEEDILHVQKATRDALEKDQPYVTIYRIKSLNGKTKYISSKGLLNKDRYGKLISLTGVCFDVTSLREGTEELVIKLNEDLLRSNKDLANFAYVASHDLQEPLRMVTSFTQLLEQQYQEKLDDKALEYIHFAVDGANRMYELINGLLLFSRVQTKGKTFTQVDLNKTVDTVRKNLGLSLLKSNASLDVTELPIVFADESQMILLFQNLIGNSIKFSNGTPKIYISSCSDAVNSTISIKDEGLGIEPQYFDKIFQIFQRLNPRDTYEGTGIGLAICKRIVERHGGKIWVESVFGKESIFYFTIPKK